MEAAAAAALSGELVVLPTDTVYGIGTRPDDPAATERVFRAKHRSPTLELPVLVPSPEVARGIAVFDRAAETLAARFWPGPLTLVLPRTERSRGWELGGDGRSVGVRMPDHPLALALLQRTGPLAVTSANPSGEATPVDPGGLERVFGSAVSQYLCSEPLPPAPPSTVVAISGTDLRMLRIGALSERAIRSALGATAGPM